MDKKPVVHITVPAWLIKYAKLALYVLGITVATALAFTLAWDTFAVQGLRQGDINFFGGLGLAVFFYATVGAYWALKDAK